MITLSSLKTIRYSRKSPIPLIKPIHRCKSIKFKYPSNQDIILILSLLPVKSLSSSSAIMRLFTMLPGSAVSRGNLRKRLAQRHSTLICQLLIFLFLMQQKKSRLSHSSTIQKRSIQRIIQLSIYFANKQKRRQTIPHLCMAICLFRIKSLINTLMRSPES